MKLHVNEGILIFPTADNLLMFEKVCKPYQAIYQRLFAHVRYAILAKQDLDYAAIDRQMVHEDRAMGVELFAKYPHLVKGAMLKVKSVFAPIKNFMDCHTMASYLETERTKQSFVLPFMNSGKFKLPYVDDLKKDGNTKGALFIEFVRSRIYRNWHATVVFESSITPAQTGAAIIAMTPSKDQPFNVCTDTGQIFKPHDIETYARFVELKSKSAGAAERRMNDTNESTTHDFMQATRDYESRVYEMEQRAYKYASQVALEIVQKFATVGWTLPETPGMKIGWDYIGLDIILAEVERLMLLAAVERRQMKSPVMKFTNMAFCPHCKHGNKSKIDGSEVICANRAHARISIYDAVANNTMRAMLGKL